MARPSGSDRRGLRAGPRSAGRRAAGRRGRRGAGAASWRAGWRAWREAQRLGGEGRAEAGAGEVGALRAVASFSWPPPTLAISGWRLVLTSDLAQRQLAGAALEDQGAGVLDLAAAWRSGRGCRRRSAGRRSGRGGVAPWRARSLTPLAARRWAKGLARVSLVVPVPARERVEVARAGPASGEEEREVRASRQRAVARLRWAHSFTPQDLVTSAETWRWRRRRRSRRRGGRRRARRRAGPGRRR